MRLILLSILFFVCLFARYENIDPETLDVLMKNQKVVIVDIRTPTEWKYVGVIPGSLLITSHVDDVLRYDDFIKKLKAQGLHDNFVLVCRSGNRSQELADRLNQEGYDNFYNLHDGIKSWIAEKRPVEKNKK